MWMSVTDEYNRTYYWNQKDDQVQWTPPTTGCNSPSTRVRFDCKVNRDARVVCSIKPYVGNTLVNRLWNQLQAREDEFKYFVDIQRNYRLHNCILYCTYTALQHAFHTWLYAPVNTEASKSVHAFSLCERRHSVLHSVRRVATLLRTEDVQRRMQCEVFLSQQFDILCRHAWSTWTRVVQQQREQEFKARVKLENADLITQLVRCKMKMADHCIAI